MLGVKGVLSVDDSLPGSMLCIRPSMWKFQAKDTHDLEICGIADKPRRLYLNRPLIKVLEDLQVPPQGILALADETIQELQSLVSSSINAAYFLEKEKIGEAAGFPKLMRRIIDIGIDIRDDRFLCSVVEMAALVRLRDLKYKGRIFVKDGIKLIGIMDETKELKEGQIHCVWLNPEGQREVVTGRVAITRSPTTHPGDVQLVDAVEVSPKSALRKLHNCVIFSQHGERDLPSQLGGGGNQNFIPTKV